MKMYFRLTQATSMSVNNVRISRQGTMSLTPGWSRNWNLGKIWSVIDMNDIAWCYYFSWLSKLC